MHVSLTSTLSLFCIFETRLVEPRDKTQATPMEKSRPLQDVADMTLASQFQFIRGRKDSRGVNAQALHFVNQRLHVDSQITEWGQMLGKLGLWPVRLSAPTQTLTVKRWLLLRCFAF